MTSLYDNEEVRREIIRIVKPDKFNVLNVKILRANKGKEKINGLAMNITDDIAHLERKFVDAGAYVTDGGKTLIFNEEFYKYYIEGKE